DLEAVALGAYAVDVDSLQHHAAEALEAACQVADPDAEDRAGVEAAGPRDQLSRRAPVDGAAARDPAGAEDEVGALLTGCDQSWYVLRVVREVAVDLDNELGAARERVVEAGDVRRPEPFLGGAVEHLDPRQRRRQPVRELPGAVRRVVVDHENAV